MILGHTKKGFTLIELLVVVAIISLLSSVVMTSLSSARKKAKDSAIKEAAHQFTTLMALNYNDYGDYCNLQAGWIGTGTCNTIFSGTHITTARNICNNIFNNTPTDGSLNRIYANTGVGCASAYSFMILLNNGKWFCTGSSGRKGEYINYNGQPGCWDNP